MSASTVHHAAGIAAADHASAVRMTGIRKAFGDCIANRDATLEVARGEIHAIVGENGAGKSTLMRVLAGLFAPNEGTVEVGGRDVTGWSTNEAIGAGVGMVHQHFMLVPTLTVAENLTLGAERVRGLQLDRAAAEAAARSLSEQTGLRVDPARTVSELSVGELQRVEILKALYRGAKVLILDEPTAVLSPPEVEELWGVLRTLRDAGGTIILITHKLDEVMAVSDTITVMQQGRTVARLRTADTTPREIARAMVGRDVALAMDVLAPRAGGDGAPLPGARIFPLLSVRNLRVSTRLRERAVDDVSFDIAPGEILGIAGVEGNGQTELVEALAGLRPAADGTVTLRNADSAEHDLLRLDVRRRGDAGLSHIPEDRHHRGLILDYTVAENLILGRQHQFSNGGSLDRARIAANAQEQIAAFDIRPTDPALPARALSGGNQQKVVIAREMGREFQVLLASQPTRGVDVGAIEFIHQRLREARAAGRAILLVSADLAEILALADRVAVMYGGRIVAVLPRSEATAEKLGPFMTGADRGAAAGSAASGT
ncbi:MAG TPA: ABC transporter ATP-binding protein [Gemmatimonadaceae bacterium]|nr:ABC transporter ATP-binding protein [Gemmatimonadaceae bacterium]